MSKKLVIDLDICRNSDNYDLQCSYNPHKANQGVIQLRELATYELVCRRCEERSCVLACPVEALEANEDGVLVRHNLRCVGCKSCQHACPFGTLLDGMIAFIANGCDMCPQLGEGEAPECVSSNTNNAVTFEEISDPLPQDMYMIGDRFAVRSKHWQRVEEKSAPQA